MGGDAEACPRDDGRAVQFRPDGAGICRTILLLLLRPLPATASRRRSYRARVDRMEAEDLSGMERGEVCRGESRRVRCCQDWRRVAAHGNDVDRLALPRRSVRRGILWTHR